MAVPTIDSATLNKPSYSPGETMVLTVVGSDADERPVRATIVLENVGSGEQSAPVTVTAVIDGLSAVVSDDSGREWTQTGRSGSTFTLTAIA
jgi:hypothetical protein